MLEERILARTTERHTGNACYLCATGEDTRQRPVQLMAEWCGCRVLHVCWLCFYTLNDERFAAFRSAAETHYPGAEIVVYTGHGRAGARWFVSRGHQPAQ